ncbi:MAG: HVO_0476 family zinc finger protein [Candidatus Thermoplasmatota archaeon]
MTARRDIPSAVTTQCPTCRDFTLHTVLQGKAGGKARGKHTLDATVQCTQCDTVHHSIVREAADVALPVVLSEGPKSRRTTITLPGDDALRINESMIIDGADAKLTGIETKDAKRVDAALVREVQTLWMKRFDEVVVGIAINLDKKTIAKEMKVQPTHEFTVGEEMVFGRLRVTVHAIKTGDRLIKRGTAEAADIKRVFAKPTPLARAEHRPDKRTREQLRFKEERQERKEAEHRGAGPR